MMTAHQLKPTVTFLEQNSPIDEYGRALYAVCRSVLRALIDALSNEDLTDLNTPLSNVTVRQLAKVVRVDLDKGMRGDGFEWAVHEAILGGESRVTEPVHSAMRRACPKIKDEAPSSLMFGQERARYLGFLDAVIEEGRDAYLLPDGSGRPFQFKKWIPVAAQGKSAELLLPDRIRQAWKTDLFLSTIDDGKNLAATIKSNYDHLEGGRGLRIGIVPESTHKLNRSGVRYDPNHKLWVVSLADPNGFMGLFNDGYHAVMRAICQIGKQPQPIYWAKPSAKAQRIVEQIVKYAGVNAAEVEDGLNDAAQQNLIGIKERLVGVNAPDWLRIKAMAPKIISPKPSFEKLD